MAGNRYIHINGTTHEEKAASQASTGAPDAGVIIAADATGKLDTSFLPTGVGPDTETVQASENLAANDAVNVWSSSGSFRVRKADGSTTGKSADGFVLSAVTSGSNATVYRRGSNSGLSGLAPGRYFLSGTTAGAITQTPPTAAGTTWQCVGVATSATVLDFNPGEPVTLA